MWLTKIGKDGTVTFNLISMEKITNTFAFYAIMTILMMVCLINSFIAFYVAKGVALIGIVGSLFAMVYFVNKSHQMWVNKRK